MRREGRLHGANARVNKKESGYGEKAPTKPTNHSKVSAKSPTNGMHVKNRAHGVPVKKSIGKVKTASKAKDLDVTRNHKMHEWSFGQQHRWGEYGLELSDDEREHPSGESDQADDYWEGASSRSPVMVCPIECLVQMRNKPSPKALQPSFPPESIPEGPAVQSESTDSDDSWSDFDMSDGDDTVFDMSDGEDAVIDLSDDEDAVADDWVLVAE